MMGVVYEAEDPLLVRTVALKTIQLGFSVPEQERQAYEQRFFTEARAAARLSHPGIVVVYDVGRDLESGRLYMALEYLEGTTLEAILAQGPLDWRAGLRLVVTLAEALHHAHTHGIVHRDVKPANVMVLESGPKIMDFGIAKLPASPGTPTGQVLGSPSYMSPERANGDPMDARGDIFSLGAVVYETVTGQRAFAGRSLPEVLLRVAHEQPPPPSAVNPGVPADLDDVVRRALAKDPRERYPDSKAFAEDLRDVLEGARPRHQPSKAARPAGETLLDERASAIFGRSAVDSGLAVAAGRAASNKVKPSKTGTDTAKRGGKPTLALPEGKRVSLAILDGAREGDVIVLDKAQVTLGRAGGASEADIPLADPQASRRHAILECHGGLIVLRDLGSKNGTWLSKRRVREVELEDGAEFRIGHTTFMLILADRE